MYYMVTLFSVVCMMFAGVVVLCYGLVIMSGEYGVRIRCRRINLDAFVYVWNYGTIICTIRIKSENVKTFIKLNSDAGFSFLVIDYMCFDYSFVKNGSGMVL